MAYSVDIVERFRISRQRSIQMLDNPFRRLPILKWRNRPFLPLPCHQTRKTGQVGLSGLSGLSGFFGLFSALG
jgi:hypothetical protein